MRQGCAPSGADEGSDGLEYVRMTSGAGHHNRVAVQAAAAQAGMHAVRTAREEHGQCRGGADGVPPQVAVAIELRSGGQMCGLRCWLETAHYCVVLERFVRAMIAILPLSRPEVGRFMNSFTMISKPSSRRRLASRSGGWES